MRLQYLSCATLFCAFLSNFCVGLRIFGCFPYVNRSQYIVGLKLLKELAARGHEVSIMAHYLSNDESNNFKFEISMGPHNTFEDHLNLTGVTELREISNMMKVPKKTLESFRFRTMLQKVNKFDVVIVDYIMNDAILGFGHFFNASIVILSNFPGYEAKLVGAETLPYGLAMFRYDYSSVLIKFYYMLLRTVEKCFMFEYNEYNEQEALYNDMFPDPKPSLAEVKNRVSLILLYTHLSVDFPRLTAPNVIPVGGFHIDDTSPPLEVIAGLNETLVIDEVKGGIIHVSLGRTFYDHPDSNRMISAMLDAFGTLRYTVLWKWDHEYKKPSSPKNVIFNHFVQQKEILNHSLTKLFVSDMGHLSHMEAIHFGIPVLALPSNFIGYHNQQFAVEVGMGLVMDLGKITKNTFLRNVKRILRNPKYAENAKLQSEIFHDRIVNPMDTAIYWIEYVAKFKGAKHLQVNPDHLALLFFESINLFVILLYIILPLFIWMGFTFYCFYRLCLRPYMEKTSKHCVDCCREKSMSEQSTPVRGTPEEDVFSANSTPIEDLCEKSITDESILAESISAESDISESFSTNSSYVKNLNEENDYEKSKDTPTKSTSAENNEEDVLEENVLEANILAVNIPVRIHIDSTSTETTTSTENTISTEVTSMNITSESNTSSENTSAESIPEESIPAEIIPMRDISAKTISDDSISVGIYIESTSAETTTSADITSVDITTEANTSSENMSAKSIPEEPIPSGIIHIEDIRLKNIPEESIPVECIPVEVVHQENNPEGDSINNTPRKNNCDHFLGETSVQKKSNDAGPSGLRHRQTKNQQKKSKKHKKRF